MRYLTLSIVLPLLSFNSYGTSNQNEAESPFMDLTNEVKALIISEVILEGPKAVSALFNTHRSMEEPTNYAVKNNVHLKEFRKAFLDLQKKPKKWINSAKKAGLSNLEPDHLLEILAVKKAFFAELVRQKESTIGNDPIKWKKHALASLLSYNAAEKIAYHTALDAASDAGKNATYHAALDVSEYTALDAAYRATSNASEDAVEDAIEDAIEDAASDAGKNATYHAALDALDASEDAAYHADLDASEDAVQNLSDYNKIEGVAYRVAETQVWITLLDPSLKTFEKAYDAAYSRVADISEEELGDWFSSKEAFERKFNEYFVEHQGLNEHSRKFLEHIKDHLIRMISKMFPSTV